MNKISNFTELKQYLKISKDFHNYLSYYKNPYNNIFLDIEKELKKNNLKYDNQNKLYNKFYLEKSKELDYYYYNFNDNLKDFENLDNILNYFEDLDKDYFFINHIEDLDYIFSNDFKDFKIFLENEYYIIVDYYNKKIFNLNIDNLEKVLKNFLKLYNLNNFNDLDLNYYFDLIENDINSFIFDLEKELNL